MPARQWRASNHLIPRICCERTIAEGTSSQLKASVGEGTLQLRVSDAMNRPAAEEVLRRVLQVPVVRDLDPTVLSAPASNTERLTAALTALSHADIQVAAVSLGQPSLDEVFLALTGHPATEASPPKHDAPTNKEVIHV